LKFISQILLSGKNRSGEKIKIKPIYIYLLSFIVFGVAVIVFSSNTKKADITDSNTQQNRMPNDDVHRGMSSGDAPSKSNVSEEAVKKIAELKAFVDKNPNDTAKTRQYADMLVFHKPDEAENYYKRILNVDSKRTDILLQLTLISFNKHDFDKAEEYTNKILSYNANYSTAYYNLGAIAVAKGDSKKAKSIWQNVVKKYPNSDAAKVASSALQQIEMAK
jgi:tetratricopeptide (TPR) repeat protein